MVWKYTIWYCYSLSHRIERTKISLFRNCLGFDPVTLLTESLDKTAVP